MNNISLQALSYFQYYFFIRELRPLTGRDAGVAEYLQAQPEAVEMLAQIETFLTRWLPAFEADQRSYDEGTTLTADLDAGVKGDLTLHIEARGTENGVEIEQWYLQRDWEPDEGTKLWDGQ